MLTLAGPGPVAVPNLGVGIRRRCRLVSPSQCSTGSTFLQPGHGLHTSTPCPSHLPASCELHTGFNLQNDGFLSPHLLPRFKDLILGSWKSSSSLWLQLQVSHGSLNSTATCPAFCPLAPQSASSKALNPCCFL